MEGDSHHRLVNLRPAIPSMVLQLFMASGNYLPSGMPSTYCTYFLGQ